MKVLLQDQRTQLYFRKEGIWVSNEDWAHDFENGITAINFKTANRYWYAGVILKFADKRYDINLSGN